MTVSSTTDHTTSTTASESPAARLMKPINNLVERFIPSALTFAIALTIVVALMAIIVTGATPAEVIVGWGDGLSGLLSFMTQMALVLLLGSMLASTRVVGKLLRSLARVPKNPRHAYVFVFVIAALACIFSWGLGLILGGLLARHVAVEFNRRNVAISFPMLIAAAYSGMVVWHMGYSGSAELTAATEGTFITDQLGYTIPLTETLLVWWNLVGIVATITAVSLTLWFIAPRNVNPSHIISADKISEVEENVEDPAVETPADRVDASRIPTLIAGLALVAYLILHFVQGGSVTLDIVNWTFLALCFLLVRSVNEMLYLVKKSASYVGDILVQFPLYAGIMGIMTATGLIKILSDSIVAVANASTLGLWSFLSAGIVNFFVPSGGGQLAVQGPILLDAAEAIGVDPAIVIMAVAYGDQWTNMIQPFWALPLLAVAGLRLRSILGYTTATLVSSGIIFAIIMLIAGFMT